MPQKSGVKLNHLKFNTETIGKRIARIRKSKGLTQEQLAKKMGIKRSRLSKYEIDRIHLLDVIVVKFAIALDVSTDYLLGLKDEPEPLSKKKDS